MSRAQHEKMVALVATLSLLDKRRLDVESTARHLLAVLLQQPMDSCMMQLCIRILKEGALLYEEGGRSGGVKRQMDAAAVELQARTLVAVGLSPGRGPVRGRDVICDVAMLRYGAPTLARAGDAPVETRTVGRMRADIFAGYGDPT